MLSGNGYELTAATFGGAGQDPVGFCSQSERADGELSLDPVETILK